MVNQRSGECTVRNSARSRLRPARIRDTTPDERQRRFQCSTTHPLMRRVADPMGRNEGLHQPLRVINALRWKPSNLLINAAK